MVRTVNCTADAIRSVKAKSEEDGIDLSVVKILRRFCILITAESTGGTTEIGDSRAHCEALLDELEKQRNGERNSVLYYWGAAILGVLSKFPGARERYRTRWLLPRTEELKHSATMKCMFNTHAPGDLAILFFSG